MNEEYIKKEDAIAVIDRCRERLQGNGSTYEFMLEMIADIPLADVVEVVRCRECKYKELMDEGVTKYYYCALEDRPNRQWSVDDTDYCSWGERKDNE